MKNRIFILVQFLIEELEHSKQLDFADDRYWLTNEYDFAEWIIHNYLNLHLENYDLSDYYLGEKFGADKYEVFNNKMEIAIWMVNRLISYFDYLRIDLECDYYELKKELEK